VTHVFALRCPRSEVSSTPEGPLFALFPFCGDAGPASENFVDVFCGYKSPRLPGTVHHSIECVNDRKAVTVCFSGNSVGADREYSPKLWE
jgi:hypothetical protein